MIAEFYDQLAPFYTLLYANWEASVKRQAVILDGIVREFFGADAQRLLDAACGIGTQCIGFKQVITLRERFFQPVLVGIK